MPAATRRRAANNGTATASAAELAAFPFRFEMAPTSRMFVDHDYQRPLTSFVNTIEENFNPSLLQPLSISERVSGKLAVIDGQTRMVAAERKGYTVLPCVVYTGLSKSDEARIFELLQTQRRNITSWTRFRAALQAKNPESLAIKRLVESIGLEVGDKPGQIKSVAALEYGYRIDDFTLERVLSVLKGAWPERVPDSQFIRGLHYFYVKSAAQIDVDDEKLVRRLKGIGAQDLALRAGHLRASKARVAGSGATSYMAQSILNAYRSN